MRQAVEGAWENLELGVQGRGIFKRIGKIDSNPLQAMGGKMGIEVGGILGLVILIADIWAIVKTFERPGAAGTKVFWIVLILLLPVLGLVIWLIAGPRSQGL